MPSKLFWWVAAAITYGIGDVESTMLGRGAGAKEANPLAEFLMGDSRSRGYAMKAVLFGLLYWLRGGSEKTAKNLFTIGAGVTVNNLLQWGLNK